EEKKPSRRLHLVVGVVAVMLISAGTFFVYLKVGSPNLPGQPVASRVAAARQKDPSIEQLAALEARTSQTPDEATPGKRPQRSTRRSESMVTR
ncbi:MAG TPA: hypothetical protein VIJ35_13415, partial [Bradyrhizobium sp.]